jgi:hypothetical protein
MREAIAALRTRVDDVFGVLNLGDLAAAGSLGDISQFRSVAHRLFYGLRHGQHHTGKLTGYLFSLGIDYDPWRG